MAIDLVARPWNDETLEHVALEHTRAQHTTGLVFIGMFHVTDMDIEEWDTLLAGAQSA